MALTDDPSVDLDVGDVLYQSDHELFLVVTGETDESYTFAAYGWRNISKQRVTEYLDGEHGQFHRQEMIDEVVAMQDDPDLERSYDRLQELFAAHESGFDEAGPQSDFEMDATDTDNSALFDGGASDE